MTTRRDFITAIGASSLVMPLSSFAQPQSKLARIGWLGPVSASYDAERLDRFRAGMRELGYVEGKNYAIEARWAEGNYDRLPTLASELVGLKVDVLVTRSTPATRAARQETSTIPIVMAGISGDPVGNGLIASLSRPGGNITGSTSISADISAKWLDLFKETMPRARQVAYLVNPDTKTTTVEAMHKAAKSLKMELQVVAARRPEEFEKAFLAMKKNSADVVAVMQDSMLTSQRNVIADLATRQRLPAVGNVAFARAGGLIGYGTSTAAPSNSTAVFVDKILKGAKPADLPVEQATKFELIVNLKTAKAIGITIPQSVLVRADKVIE